jgi:PAS domain S-box-containing protein
MVIMTRDDTRSRQALIDELAQARRRIKELEFLEDTRLRAEKALKESEYRARAILDHTFQFIGLMKPDGTLIEANRTALSFAGLTEQNVIGKLFWETPWWTHSADLVEKLREGIRRAAAGELVRFEADHPRAEGEVTYVDVSLKPVTDDAGEVVYIIPEGRDITDRKRAEQESQRLALAVMHSSELVNMATLDGQMIFLNAAGMEMLGIEADQVGRTNIMEVIPEHLVPLVTQKLLPTLMKGGAWRGELQYTNLKTGELRDVHAVTYVVPDPITGDPRFLANVSMDITELKRADRERRAFETQVQHVQKLESLGVLAGGIAHDFNNLLTGILGNADLALRVLPRHSPAESHLGRLHVAAQRAADLCRQLLAYSGQGSFVVEQLSLNDVVREMTHMLDVSVSKKARVSFALGDDLPAVEADASQVGQVVMNLLTNASEAIDDREGRITVRTEVMQPTGADLTDNCTELPLEQKRYVSLEVSDTGCGMAPEVVQRMFDPFYTTKFTGRGLGLAAVLGIVRGHRGGIKVDSRPGWGTTVKVLFPATEAACLASERRPRACDEWQGTGLVLVVDDEEAVRTVAQQMLAQMGFTTLLAEDGKAALELFRRRHYDIACVLLDLTMPRMDGQQTYGELHRINPDVPVVVCSGYAEQEVARQFAGAGMVSFLKKPFQYRDLLESMQAAMVPLDA